MPEASFCFRCGQQIGMLPRRKNEDPTSALRFLRMAVFAFVMSALVFPPLFRTFQPRIPDWVQAIGAKWKTLLGGVGR